MSETLEVFDRLFAVDVSKQIEKKQNLSYLSWSYAWANVKKRYPNCSYEIVKQPNGLPYAFDENTGYMVFTKVTINDVTHEMWLPVMDNNNNAMLSHPYEYTTKYGKKTVQACTMFDVNKAIMRCLTKNLAMFGLGLCIYAGEDLPFDVEDFDNVSEAESIDNCQSWHDRLEVLVAYHNKDIPAENIKMIEECCDGNDENKCEEMYHRTETYLRKTGKIK